MDSKSCAKGRHQGQRRIQKRQRRDLSNREEDNDKKFTQQEDDKDTSQDKGMSQ